MMLKERGGASLFGFPNLLVGLNKLGGGGGGGDSSRSPTSPLDGRAFVGLGGCLARSPSPRSPAPAGFDRPLNSWGGADRVGLGLADALLVGDNNSCLRVVTAAASPRSLPKNYVAARGGWPPDQFAGVLPEPADLGKDRSSSSSAGVERSSRQRKNLMLEAPHFDQESKDGGSLSRSSPAAVAAAAARGFVTGSLSAVDIEQSEDYTCIISHGPNPKTTRIFGDYILESYPSDLSDLVARKEGDEGSAAPWMLGRPEEPPPPFSAGNFLSVCNFCKKKLEGKDVYMYGGEKAFCSSSCRARQIVVEADTDESGTATGSFSTSPSSTSCEEIFLLSLDTAA